MVSASVVVVASTVVRASTVVAAMNPSGDPLCALLATGCCERWAVRAAEEVLGLAWTVAVSVVVVSTAVVAVAPTRWWRKLHRSAAAGKGTAGTAETAGTAGSRAGTAATIEVEGRLWARSSVPRRKFVELCIDPVRTRVARCGKSVSFLMVSAGGRERFRRQSGL